VVRVEIEVLRPRSVEKLERLEMYPEDPRPLTVETTCVVET
jgi:hypothetical protein